MRVLYNSDALMESDDLPKEAANSRQNKCLEYIYEFVRQKMAEDDWKGVTLDIFEGKKIS